MALLFLDILNWIFSSGLGIRDKSPPTLTIDWLTYRNRPIRTLSVLHALHEAHTQTSTRTHTQGPSLPLPFCRARATCVEAQSLSRMRALITRSRFRDILTHLRASGSRYQYAGDSRNFRETWDVCQTELTAIEHELLTQTPKSLLNNPNLTSFISFITMNCFFFVNLMPNI